MTYDHVYLSPHLDDAVFSCGGTIALQRARGERVLVVTVCTGGLAARLAEDERALRSLDVAFEWAGELDAPDRLPQHYYSRTTLLGNVAPGDPLVAFANALVRSCAPGALLHAPLGVGRHVDHQIVHAAARAAGRPVIFYEDVPYVLEPGAVDLRLGELEPMTPIVTDIATTFAQRTAAIACYASQLGDAARAQIATYARELGDGVPSERSWALLR